MSSRICRNGYACQRPDCYFQHPEGRAIDSAVRGAPPAASAGGSGGGPAVCRFGRACHRHDCYFLHPEGRNIDKPSAQRVPAWSLGGGGTGMNESKTASQRPTSTSPAAEFNPDEWEEASPIHASPGCECCQGQPLNCQSAGCAAQGGRCGCTFGEDANEPEEQFEDEGEDSWRDEWYPQSRECECCAGTIYRCKMMKNECKVKGQCYCYHGEPHPTAASASSRAASSSGPSAPAQNPTPDFNPDEWEGPSSSPSRSPNASPSGGCDCCQGQPYNCQSSGCKAQGGKCGCTFGQDDQPEDVLEGEADDGWRDEWYPQSRNCACCAGTVYRCKLSKDECKTKGHCFCYQPPTQLNGINA